MVTQNIVTRKFNHCVICLLLPLFLLILLDRLFTLCGLQCRALLMHLKNSTEIMFQRFTFYSRN